MDNLDDINNILSIAILKEAENMNLVRQIRNPNDVFDDSQTFTHSQLFV